VDKLDEEFYAEHWSTQAVEERAIPIYSFWFQDDKKSDQMPMSWPFAVWNASITRCAFWFQFSFFLSPSLVVDRRGSSSRLMEYHTSLFPLFVVCYILLQMTSRPVVCSVMCSPCGINTISIRQKICLMSRLRENTVTWISTLTQILLAIRPLLFSLGFHPIAPGNCLYSVWCASSGKNESY
jgi:hypothetical protein